jgi:hypothetical protein
LVSLGSCPVVPSYCQVSSPSVLYNFILKVTFYHYWHALVITSNSKVVRLTLKGKGSYKGMNTRKQVFSWIILEVGEHMLSLSTMKDIWKLFTNWTTNSRLNKFRKIGLIYTMISKPKIIKLKIITKKYKKIFISKL